MEGACSTRISAAQSRVEKLQAVQSKGGSLRFVIGEASSGCKKQIDEDLGGSAKFQP